MIGGGYTYDEVKSNCIIDIIEREIKQNNFLHIWVDEIAISPSIRYKRRHFVHPMMVYGYDEERQIVKAVQITDKAHLKQEIGFVFC